MAKAKGYKLPGLNKALKTVNTLGNQMTREADADYAVALSALRAGQQGLAKQTRGLTRDLLAGQLKSTTSLSKLAKAARAEKAVVANKQANTTSKYGAALGQSVSRSYGTATAIAGGTAKVLTGAARAGKATTGVATTVAGIAQAGVAAQASAAKYSMNQALQQRAIIDNQTLAGMTSQLYQTALQYNADMAMYERQRADALSDARKAEVGETKDTVEWLTSTSGDMGSWLQSADELNTYDVDGKFDVAAAIEAYTAEMGLNPEVVPRDADQLAVMTVAMRGMAEGVDATTAITNAMNELFQGKAGWEKVSTNLMGSTSAYIAASMEAKSLTTIQGFEGVTYDTGDVSGLPLDLGDIYWGNRQGSAMQSRDAAARAIMDAHGSSVARAWLRGTGAFEGNDVAINYYLSNLPSAADLGNPTLNLVETGSAGVNTTGYVPPPTYAPRVAPTPK
jgi:hypothetical protein